VALLGEVLMWLWGWGSGSHTNTVVADFQWKWWLGPPSKKLGGNGVFGAF